jgi:TonB family protein
MSRIALAVAVVSLSVSCSKQETARPAEVPHVAMSKPAPAPVAEAPGLEEDQIRQVVESRNGAVRGCHTIEYAGRDTSGGSMTVDLSINPDGAVDSVVVVESDFDSEPMQQCVVEVTRGLRFPEAPGATEVSWRFRFRAPQG